MTGAPMLTLVDLAGIQRWVFAGNRLVDIAGASTLVERAIATAEDLAGSNALVAAGGNVVCRFADLAEARSFATRFTRWLVDQAPGLEATIVHQALDGGLARSLSDGLASLARAKGRRATSSGLLGLGVTASCRQTGQVAVAVDAQDKVPIGAQVKGARAAGTVIWDHLLTQSSTRGFRCVFPVLHDRLVGRTEGDRSRLAVVHVDGNGIGDLAQRWLERCLDEERCDDEVAREYGRWSEGLRQRMWAALGAAVERVAKALVLDAPHVSVAGKVVDLNFELCTEVSDDGEIEVSLPLRPVVLGGDDMTFVCDARLALDLAVTVMEHIENGGDIPSLGPVSACAGLAIGPAHHPFSRLYEHAEALCASAKRARSQGAWTTGALDWELGPVPLGEAVDARRARQLRSTRGATTYQLTMRPYPLHDTNGTDARWLLRDLLGQTRSGLRGPAWAASRGKVKDLAGLARNRDLLRRRLAAWAPDLKLPAPIDSSGYHGAVTPLLDGVELLDLAQDLS